MTTKPAPTYRFGIFELDLRSGELRRNGSKLKIQEQSLQVLALLLAHPGEPVTRDELRNQLWPADTFVDFDHSINAAIKRLREALSDEAENPRFIETLPRRGYRFVAPVNRPFDGAPTRWTGNKFPRSIIVSALVLAALALAIYLSQRRSAVPTPAKVGDSIAVLPFDTASVDPELEYLADGITESTIDHLSRSPDLKVISMASVLPYRGRQVSPEEIGRTLGVRRIMIGKIVIQHERMIVLAELINTADGTHIWGEQYNRKLADIISAQEDIATKIAAKLQIGMTEEQLKLFRKRYTEDFEAYKLYIRGRYYWNKRDVPDLQRGLSYFQQAIDRDPTYALAYAGLADAYFVECAAGAIPTREGFPKAKAAALAALELDDSLAAAHASLAHIYFDYDWNWTEAEAEYKKAIALGPSYSVAHYFYGTFLLAMARNTEAFAELRRAQELDPLSPMIATFIGKAYYFSRNNRESIAQYRKVIQSNPRFPVAQNFLVETLERAGLFEEALAQIDANNQHAKQDPDGPALRRAYQSAGAQGYLQERIRQIRLDPHGEAGGLSGGTAALYAVLGDKDQAFNMLERAHDRHELWLAYLKVDPAWDNLRTDPRFQNLLHRVGLA